MKCPATPIENGHRRELAERAWTRALDFYLGPALAGVTLGKAGDHLTITGALEDLAFAERCVAEAIAGLVQAAHAGGHSWAEIGAALGVSKQAAHERWSPKVHTAIELTATPNGRGRTAASALPSAP